MMRLQSDASERHMVRETIGRQIEELIALLDCLDGDADLEDAGEREDDARHNPKPIYGDDQCSGVLAWNGGQGAALDAFRAEKALRSMEMLDHAS